MEHATGNTGLRGAGLIGGITLFGLMLLALIRPVDHDESQYVAAALLATRGLPYRDFAYLQTPLQPLLLAPLALVAGTLAYPALRLANAAFGAITLGATFAAARAAGASTRAAGLSVAAMAATDIFLFTSAVARNDALPGAALGVALWLAMRAQAGRGTPAGAAAAGVLFAAAAGAKISFALPALVYGLYALADRRHRPGMLVLGAAPVALLVFALYRAAPEAFVFGVFRFPALAPAEWYVSQGLPGKLSLAGKAVDAVKFLALGPALLALGIVARAPRGRGAARLADLLIVGALVSALLPVPTWRQYLLPVLPPLFVRLALVWDATPPRRAVRIWSVIFACAGLAPTVEALAVAARRGVPMVTLVAAGRDLRARYLAAGGTAPVATLAPQLLPAAGLAIDPRFAAGPFYFRSRGLVDRAGEARMHLVSRATVEQARLGAILTGGEAKWSAGEPGDEAPLIAYARARGWRRIAIGGPAGGYGLVLWLPPARVPR